jgi:hypothetical protein
MMRGDAAPAVKVESDVAAPAEKPETAE